MADFLAVKLWFGKESKTVGRRPTPCKPLKRLNLNFDKSKRECIRQIKIYIFIAARLTLRYIQFLFRKLYRKS